MPSKIEVLISNKLSSKASRADLVILLVKELLLDNKLSIVKEDCKALFKTNI